MTAYARMLPELEAEQQLNAIEASSVPHMTDSGRTRILDRLTRRAQNERRPRSAAEALASLPIPIRYFPKEVK